MKNYLFSVFLIFFLLKIDRIYSSRDFYTADNNKKYYIEKEQKFTWFDALVECAKVNMSLLTIETKLKSDVIKAIMKSKFDGYIPIWIGGVAVGNSDSRAYTWISNGEKFSYSAWSKFNPDFYAKNEYCVQLTSHALWNDLNCDHKLGFVCEISQQQQLRVNLEKELQQEVQKQETIKQEIKNLKMRLKTAEQAGLAFPTNTPQQQHLKEYQQEHEDMQRKLEQKMHQRQQLHEEIRDILEKQQQLQQGFELKPQKPLENDLDNEMWEQLIHGNRRQTSINVYVLQDN